MLPNQLLFTLSQYSMDYSHHSQQMQKKVKRIKEINKVTITATWHEEVCWT